MVSGVATRYFEQQRGQYVHTPTLTPAALAALAVPTTAVSESPSSVYERMITKLTACSSFMHLNEASLAG